VTKLQSFGRAESSVRVRRAAAVQEHPEPERKRGTREVKPPRVPSLRFGLNATVLRPRRVCFWVGVRRRDCLWRLAAYATAHPAFLKGISRSDAGPESVRSNASNARPAIRWPNRVDAGQHDRDRRGSPCRRGRDPRPLQARLGPASEVLGSCRRVFFPGYMAMTRRAS